MVFYENRLSVGSGTKRATKTQISANRPTIDYRNIAVEYYTTSLTVLLHHDCQTMMWWRHQMKIFPALLALCEGNSPVIGEIPSKGPVTQSFDVFFYLYLNKRLSKPSRRRWYGTPSRPLRHHCTGTHKTHNVFYEFLTTYRWVSARKT